MRIIHKHLHLASVTLLIILGIAALFSGAVFIYDPTGRTLKMPISALDHSPFTNYLVPGIILFAVIGISSVIITVLTVKKIRYYELFIAYKGLILVAFIVAQFYLIEGTHPLQAVMLIYGFVIFALGLILYKKNFQP